MESGYRKCPHCGNESIKLQELKKAKWSTPCKCPECQKCCNSRIFIIFLLSIVVYFVIDPLVIIIGTIYFGWKIALTSAVLIIIAATIAQNIVITKLQPVKVLCR